MTVLDPGIAGIELPVLCLEVCILSLAITQSSKPSILLTSDSFFPSRGGGDLSLRILARNLSSMGYQISVAFFGEEKDPEFESTLLRFSPAVRGFWPRHMAIRNALEHDLRRVIARQNPDVVITQQLAMSPTIDSCSESEIPVIVLLRGVDFLCLGSFWSGIEKRCDYRCVGCEDADSRLLQYPFFRKEIARIRKSLCLADSIVSNSEYTRRTLKSILGLESRVMTPPIEHAPSGCRIREDGTILFVSPVRHKGVDVAIELSRRLKEERFVFVGDAKRSTIRRLERLDNVDYIPWVSDMEPCYSASKLVIVPSVIPEGYGRVCAEAQIRGLPCVVSAVGALPEVVAGGGDVVHNSRDVDSWVDIVRRYSHPTYVREKSARAIENASGFTTHDKHAACVDALIGTLVTGGAR